MSLESSYDIRTSRRISLLNRHHLSLFRGGSTVVSRRRVSGRVVITVVTPCMALMLPFGPGLPNWSQPCCNGVASSLSLSLSLPPSTHTHTHTHTPAQLDLGVESACKQQKNCRERGCEGNLRLFNGISGKIPTSSVLPPTISYPDPYYNI